VNGGNGANGTTYENCFNAGGTYTVSADVTDINGCQNSTIYLVNAYPVPVADFNFAPIKPIINLDEVSFTDASYNATIQTWNWYFYSNASNTSNLQNPNFYYPEAGTYPVTLVVKSDHGCMDTITKTIVVGEDYGIYVPNAFTPNADGLNDVFQPKGFGITKYQLQIFDRWGERIFETKNFEQGWDGRFKSKGLDYEKTCEQGVYTWLINVTNVFGKATELKGHVTLIK
jgi:gliding motility-associated-like protein